MFEDNAKYGVVATVGGDVFHGIIGLLDLSTEQTVDFAIARYFVDGYLVVFIDGNLYNIPIDDFKSAIIRNSLRVGRIDSPL